MRKTWIKKTVLLLGMTLAATALVAQQEAAPAAAPEGTNQSASATTGTTGKLQLTVEQRKQLRQLRQSARDQAAIIRNDQTLNAEQMQAKLQALRVSTRQQMMAVLTPAQQTMMTNRRAERRARIAAKLGLTPEQQSKLKDLFIANRQQRQSVLHDASLTNQQKLAQLSQIRQSSKAQLATILTPEQLAKFRQMRMARRHHPRG